MSKCDGCASKGDCSDGTCGEVRLPPGILNEYNITDDVTDGTMIIISSYDDDSIGSSSELIGKAKDLDIGRVFAVVFGDASRKEIYNELFEYGVDTIYHIRSAVLNEFNAERYSSAVLDVIQRVRPSLVLAFATANGKEMMSNVASVMGEDVMQCKEQGCDLMPASTAAQRTSTPRLVVVEQGTFPTIVRQDGRKGTALNIPYSGK